MHKRPLRLIALAIVFALLLPVAAQAAFPGPLRSSIARPRTTVAAIRLNRASAAMTLGNAAYPGTPLKLTATVYPASSEHLPLVWKSSNEKIAAVTPNGEVTALSEGRTVISAMDEASGKRATCAVKVSAIKVKSITLNRSNAVIDMKEQLQLTSTIKPANATYGEVTWSVLDGSVLQVEGGLVTPKKSGTTKVVAKAGGQKAMCTVRVLKGEAVEVTISAAGDTVLGGDPRPKAKQFPYYQKFYDMVYSPTDGRDKGNPVFGNVAKYFKEDDFTLVNLECTLSARRSGIQNSRSIVLFGKKEDAMLLKQGGVEMVALTNNHAQNAGSNSKRDTKSALQTAGVRYTDTDEVGVYTTPSGVKIGVCSFFYYYATLPTDALTVTIKRLKRSCDIVLVYYHWGFAKQFVYSPAARNMKRQTQIARAAVDAGADLVVSSHTHRYNGIERYKNKYIVYDLGNFVFSARGDVTDKRTYIFQQTFRYYPQSKYLDLPAANHADINVVPCLISSDGVWDDPVANNAYPTEITGAEGRALIDHVNSLSNAFTYGVQIP